MLTEVCSGKTSQLVLVRCVDGFAHSWLQEIQSTGLRVGVDLRLSIYGPAHHVAIEGVYCMVSIFN
jgi:hypothetical protein